MKMPTRLRLTNEHLLADYRDPWGCPLAMCLAEAGVPIGVEEYYVSGFGVICHKFNGHIGKYEFIDGEAFNSRTYQRNEELVFVPA